MINKISRLAISILLLFCASSYAPAYGISVKTAGSSILQENIPDKVVNHSSFVQIPKQVFNVCVKVSKALQIGMLTSFSNNETVIKTFYKIMNFSVFFCTANLNEVKNLKTSYTASRIKYEDNQAKNNVSGSFIFMLFGILQLLLCLLAVKKANLPYAIILNKNQKTRYLI